MKTSLLTTLAVNNADKPHRVRGPLRPVPCLLVAVAVSLLVLTTGCRQAPSLVLLDGPAQGSTFHISYYAAEARDLRPSIDSILVAVDKSMSTYDSLSLISGFNSGNDTITADPMFLNVLQAALQTSAMTGGAFDVTVAPLVNAWGFGFRKAGEVTPQMIDSLRQFVGVDKIVITGNKISKTRPGVMLDFNAIAQGYTVDLICGFLESRGITDYLVEVGGEIKAHGVKEDGSLWNAGIDKPVPSGAEDRQLQATLTLDNQALATSGNYRKFYEKDGRRYAHTIDPRTGHPVEHNLLSASVVAGDCMTADALATAFMVMGLSEAVRFLESHAGIDAYLIYHDAGEGMKSYVSPGLQNRLKELN